MIKNSVHLYLKARVRRQFSLNTNWFAILYRLLVSVLHPALGLSVCFAAIRFNHILKH